MRRLPRRSRLGWLLWGALCTAAATADPVSFDIAREPAAAALLAFSKQAHVDVLFDYGALSKVPSPGLQAKEDPANALVLLLSGTGYSARVNPSGGFVVAKAPKPPGRITGTLVDASGAPAAGLRVAIPDLLRSAFSDSQGRFAFEDVPPGTYSLFTAGGDYQPDVEDGVRVASGKTAVLQVPPMKAIGSPSLLETIFVKGLTDANALDDSRDTQRVAAGNVDLPRSMDDALPYEIYGRDKIAKSGAITLDEFLRMEVLQTSATSQPPDQNGQELVYQGGSSNLNLRGFGPQDTVILVNGRPLPAVVNAVNAESGYQPPNVNLFPLSMVERVEVLPVSASALYEGDPVGGVINIILRPDIEATELTATYSNTAQGYDASNSSLSLVHGASLLDGKLTYRLDATVGQSTPATEQELGYIKTTNARENQSADLLFGSTPNVWATDKQTGLFGPGSSWFASVAPGASPATGLANLGARQGIANDTLLQTPPGDSDSIYDANYNYGHRRKSATYYLSSDYQVFPWIQIGAEGLYTRTYVNGGYNVGSDQLFLPMESPFNPFGTDVKINLLEAPTFLGEDYDQARITLESATLSAVLTLPALWRVTFDGQATRSLTEYRGVSGYDGTAWENLTESGAYNPFRDTEAFPSQVFDDQVVELYGGRGKYVTMGDYRTLSLTFRVSNQAIPLPTGLGVVNGGVDYHRDQLESFPGSETYGDGTPVTTYNAYTGRTLSQVSTFAEVQVPLLPKSLRPSWLKGIEFDGASRYTFADTSLGTSFAPTGGLKVDIAGGLSVRASVSTTNRFDPAYLSRLNPVSPAQTGGSTGATGPQAETDISDPLRGGQQYGTSAALDLNPQIKLEGDVTQTAGLVFERGDERHLRISVDFTDTLAENEEEYLSAQDAVNLEAYFPSRIVRAAPALGDPYSVGPITSILYGNIKSGKRHSQDWNTAVDYAWRHVWGGTLDLHANWVHLQSYKLKHVLGTPYIDELASPDIGSDSPEPLLRNRINYGVGWAGPVWETGVDGQYFGPHALPVVDRSIQGATWVESYRQYDTFLKADLLKLLGLSPRRFGLTGEVRLNNVFNVRPPYDVSSSTATGYDSYTDWRGRNYSLSFTATY